MILNQELLLSLAQYLQENFSSKNIEPVDYIPVFSEVKSGDSKNIDGEKYSLDELLDDVGISFHDMLFQLISRSGMTEVEIYKKAHIDRKLFSKIRSNPAYHPRKQTVLALSIALSLSINDTVDLLSRAEYALSPNSKGDLIIKFFIEQGIYDITTINFVLSEYGQPTLF